MSETFDLLNRLVAAGCEIKMGGFNGKTTEKPVWSAHISLDGNIHTRFVVHAEDPRSALAALAHYAKTQWPELLRDPS